MKRIFLTGITGLVGSAFAVKLLQERDDCELICLVRPSGGKNALERTKEVIQSECKFEGCPEIADKILSHITAVDGDVVTLDPESMAKDPRLNGVNCVFHCAADVNLGKDPTGKVFRINYEGTQNVVKLAQLLKVEEIHYVGTAYVAGKLQGTAYEHAPIDNGFNNPYEESKFKAEYLVRNSGIPFTVYRPGIVTGRRSDGRIRKPLAFYRLLEFLCKFKSHQCTKHGINPEEWVDLHIGFKTQTSEHIYFVPIDYVQEAITALFQLPVNNTGYHITGDSPVTTEEIRNAVSEIMHVKNVFVGNDNVPENVDTKLMAKFVGDLFPYFATDITFDQTNVRKALGDKVLDWEYGQKALETLMRSYYLDYFKNTEWVQNLVNGSLTKTNNSKELV